jgi:hypothetical protein
MLSEDWRELCDRLAKVTVRKNESEHRLELMGGGVIEMWSLENPDASRGRKYSHAVINEAAMVRDLTNVWNMVIRPTLADFQGGADFPSTPKGLNGFYDLWQQAGGDDEGWARFHFRTDDNPHIARGEVDAMRASLPERVVRQEIDALFVEDGTYFQRIEEAAIIQKPDTPDQHEGHYLVMGVDWALSNDYTVLTVACRTCNRVVDWERFNNIDFTYQRERLVTMASRWRALVMPERNSIGEPNIELLHGRVQVLSGPDGKAGFNTSATTKPMLIQGLAAALEHHGFQVPASYADELRSYEVEMGTSGHPKFSAPSGAHDDRVISLALAWYALSSSGPAEAVVTDSEIDGWHAERRRSSWQ